MLTNEQVQEMIQRADLLIRHNKETIQDSDCFLEEFNKALHQPPRDKAIKGKNARRKRARAIVVA